MVPRLGIGSWTLPRHVAAGRLGHRDLLELAILHGCGAVQYADNLPLTALAPNDLRDLLHQAEDAEVVIEPGARGMDGEELRRLLEIALRSGSEFVRLVLPRERFDPDLTDLLVGMDAVAARYRDAGVRLALENHDMMPAPQLLELGGALGAAFCLDTANSLVRKEPETVVADILGEGVINLHAKEVAIRRVPDDLGFEIHGVPTGEGWVAWEHLWPAIPNVLSVTLEQWVPAGPGALDQERAWIGPSLGFLRTQIAERNRRLAA